MMVQIQQQQSSSKLRIADVRIDERHRRDLGEIAGLDSAPSGCTTGSAGHQAPPPEPPNAVVSSIIGSTIAASIDTISANVATATNNIATNTKDSGTDDYLFFVFPSVPFRSFCRCALDGRAAACMRRPRLRQARSRYRRRGIRRASGSRDGVGDDGGGDQPEQRAAGPNSGGGGQ